MSRYSTPTLTRLGTLCLHGGTLKPAARRGGMWQSSGICCWHEKRTVRHSPPTPSTLQLERAVRWRYRWSDAGKRVEVTGVQVVLHLFLLSSIKAIRVRCGLLVSGAGVVVIKSQRSVQIYRNVAEIFLWCGANLQKYRLKVHLLLISEGCLKILTLLNFFYIFHFFSLFPRLVSVNTRKIKGPIIQ